MIKKLPADDLFEKSSMTFGEHLEELRRALVKALIWLGIGMSIGLLFADSIVKYIETPLRGAITGYYIERAKLAYEEANGKKPSEELALWMVQNHMMPEVSLVDPAALRFLLGGESPDASLTDTAVGDAQNSQTQAETEKTAEPTSSSQEVESTASDQAVTPQSPWKGVDFTKLVRLRPLIQWKPIPNKLIALSSMEPFMMWLKAGLVAGVIIGSPGIFWHIWQFFAAGLYPHERRYVYWYLPLSLLLFFAGVALAFYVIFRLILQFLIGYSTSLDVEFAPRLSDYMTFAMMLPLGFGLAFQLPIVMLGLHRFGIVTADTFLTQWRIAVLAISFLAMLLTPADPYSMLGLTIPLVFLYFMGIVLCHYMPKGAGIGSPALDP
jgi:sec-independent protein translocase protein TatC